eukprot:5830314-Pleurochrysis_carterae.AAC.1
MRGVGRSGARRQRPGETERMSSRQRWPRPVRGMAAGRDARGGAAPCLVARREEPRCLRRVLGRVHRHCEEGRLERRRAVGRRGHAQPHRQRH